jgi:hypothetical protein
MIPKSGYRFSEKIMRQQTELDSVAPGARCRREPSFLACLPVRQNNFG